MDKIREIAVLKLIGTRIPNHAVGFLFALHTVDSNLYALVKILNPNAHPVEAEFAEQGHGRRIHLPRIDFDRVFATFEKLEMLLRFTHQQAHFIVRQEGRRTTAPMQLNDFMLAIAAFQTGRLEIKFLGEILQVFGTAPMILGDDLVTRAVIANSVAEGDVEV